MNASNWNVNNFLMIELLNIQCSVNKTTNAPVTRPYICQRTPTYGDTSDKLGARFI